jgi:phage terminase large subunit
VAAQSQYRLVLPSKFQPLFRPARYKCFHGGRGSSKSWSIAAGLVARARAGKERILCTREFQSSIRDSVHRVIADRIASMGVSDEFAILRDSIVHRGTGSEFLFKGLRHNIQEIKSLEGVTICWCEEAQSISEDSWIILDPTIRADGSEIWITFNPDQVSDPTYKRFVKDPPPDCVTVEVNWEDNPWFPEVLEKQRQHALAIANATGDWDAYNWIWGGKCRLVSDAVIFKRRVRVHNFETPLGVHFQFGSDWGFANDPTVLIRNWMNEARDELFIDAEAWGYGTEIDEIPALFDKVPESRKWKIRADNARPETISYVLRQGFNIEAADKWKGSVEDGIAHLKGFKVIHIHESNCPKMVEEAKLYSWKTDKQTGEILPVPVDAWNHGWDALRYSLTPFMQNRGAMGIWAKLAEKD